LTRREAIALAYQRCAGAMIQTTIICGLGLLVFSFSSFVPTSRFAWLMGAMLGTALIGDLLLLPALLASPLGRFFERKPVIEPQPATERVAELKPATV
jgi:predicted RND superfamily exporter protein